MQDSIFTKIIKGEIPSYKVYEDDLVYAFLDIYPIQPGHTLVVPKKQVDHLDDLDEHAYLHMFGVVKKISIRVKQVFGANRACLQVLGFDIPHAHVHVIPCNKGQDFYHLPDRSQEPDRVALSEIANKLFFIKEV
jgi:histidine triad (HIT) family protein